MKKSDKTKEKAFASISAKSFITVVLVLCVLIAAAGVMSYIIPQGSFLRDDNGTILLDTYVEGEIEGIALWRVLTAPARVFVSEDALTVIMISVFLLVMSGVFNLLERTGGVKIFISHIIHRFNNKSGAVVCLTVLIFMLFGSLFGMFEELVTLLPIVTVFMLSMGMDTMMGLGVCLVAACFGFASATTNPFSVGLASQVAGVDVASGMWLRIVFFAVVYATLCAFLLLYLRKINKTPERSLTYEVDKEKRGSLALEAIDTSDSAKLVFKVFSVFFGVQALVLVLIATVKPLSSLAIPILAVSFLFGGVISGLLVCEKKGNVLRFMAQGAASMLPAVLMIALASSVKLVMTESGIIDTVMHYAIDLLDGKNKYVAVILIYLLILFLQFFIGSASAKIILVMPIVMPIANSIGLSPSLVILAYCMADGFTDVIMPTNPILLVGLSVANVSYGKWVKWTFKLQLFVLALTVLVLFFGVFIGY